MPHAHDLASQRLFDCVASIVLLGSGEAAPKCHLAKLVTQRGKTLHLVKEGRYGPHLGALATVAAPTLRSGHVLPRTLLELTTDGGRKTAVGG